MKVHLDITKVHQAVLVAAQNLTVPALGIVVAPVLLGKVMLAVLLALVLVQAAAVLAQRAVVFREVQRGLAVQACSGRTELITRAVVAVEVNTKVVLVVLVETVAVVLAVMAQRTACPLLERPIQAAAVAAQQRLAMLLAHQAAQVLSSFVTLDHKKALAER